MNNVPDDTSASIDHHAQRFRLLDNLNHPVGAMARIAMRAMIRTEPCICDAAALREMSGSELYTRIASRPHWHAWVINNLAYKAHDAWMDFVTAPSYAEAPWKMRKDAVRIAVLLILPVDGAVGNNEHGIFFEPACGGPTVNLMDVSEVRSALESWSAGKKDQLEAAREEGSGGADEKGG